MAKSKKPSALFIRVPAELKKTIEEMASADGDTVNRYVTGILTDKTVLIVNV